MSRSFKELPKDGAPSRQRSRVRVSSSPPFFLKHLRGFSRNHGGSKRARFGALFCVPFRSVPFALQLILVFPELSSAKTMVIAVRAPSPVRIALNRANHSFPSDANSMQILLGPAKQRHCQTSGPSLRLTNARFPRCIVILRRHSLAQKNLRISPCEPCGVGRKAGK